VVSAALAQIVTPSAVAKIAARFRQYSLSIDQTLR